jgi:hypothetical protein
LDIDVEWIDLSENYLTGTIPDQIGRMENLEALVVHYNNLGGPLPKLENPYLSELILGENRFRGTVPSEYGYLNELRVLHLDYNAGLTGSIPENFGRLKLFGKRSMDRVILRSIMHERLIC